MSWEEPCVEGWLIPLLACSFGPDWLKTWLLGASFKLLAERVGACTRPRDSRVVLKGIGKDGLFKSRTTARYPVMLAEEFAQIVAPLLDGRPSACGGPCKGTS